RRRGTPPERAHRRPVSERMVAGGYRGVSGSERPGSGGGAPATRHPSQTGTFAGSGGASEPGKGAVAGVPQADPFGKVLIRCWDSLPFPRWKRRSRPLPGCRFCGWGTKKEETSADLFAEKKSPRRRVLLPAGVPVNRFPPCRGPGVFTASDHRPPLRFHDYIQLSLPLQKLCRSPLPGRHRRRGIGGGKRFSLKI